MAASAQPPQTIANLTGSTLDPLDEMLAAARRANGQLPTQYTSPIGRSVDNTKPARDRTPYILEPTLQEQVFGMQLPGDVAVDDAGWPRYRDNGEKVPVVERPNVFPIARAPDGERFLAWPHILDYILSVGAINGLRVGGQVVRTAQTIEALGGAGRDARPVAQTLEQLAKAAPSRPVEMPQTIAALGETAPNVLASRSSSIYNPTPRPVRDFSQDYKEVGTDVADETGRLLRNIDGKPFDFSKPIVGRQTVGGVDVPFDPARFDALAEAAIGSKPQGVAKSSVPGKGAGAYVHTRGKDGPVRSIYYDKQLAGQTKEMVVGHEIAHMSDKGSTGRGIGAWDHPKKVENQLKDIYHELNKGAPRAKGERAFGPADAGYRGTDIQDEYWAEAIRAYNADPNFMKTVAPDVAEIIRQNANYIQFNSSAPPGSIAGLLRDEQGQ